MQFRNTRIIYGQQHHSLCDLKVLVVGVGGIGCEILKCLSKLPVKQVDIADLDTIETSNLNRQFLFRQEHRGQSKSLTARESLLRLNPGMNVIAHHCNIREMSLEFFRQFGLVIMALDNIEARTFVNQICICLNLPAVDAGTTGYLGQVQFILPHKTKCYSCQKKLTPEMTFPVCTIRRRPEKPIHCIVWAKFVFEMLFGLQKEEEEGNQMTDLEQFAKEVRRAQLGGNKDWAGRLAEYLFVEGVEQGLGEKDLKKGVAQIINKEEFYRNQMGSPVDMLSVQELSNVQPIGHYIRNFKEAVRELAKRLGDGSIPGMAFQKDDDVIMAFVAAASNLRMHTFKIPLLTQYKIKQMAGNIIPAIASTNSIVSGLQITEAYKHLTGNHLKMKNIYVKNIQARVSSSKLQPPNPQCTVCGVTWQPVIIECPFHSYTLSDLISFVKQHRPTLSEFSINNESKNEIFESTSEEDYPEGYLARTISTLTTNKISLFYLMDDETYHNICGIMLADSEKVRVSNLEMIFQERVDRREFEQEEEKAMREEYKVVGGAIAIDEEDDQEESLEICEVIPEIQKPEKRHKEVMNDLTKRVNPVNLAEIQTPVGKRLKTD